MRWTLYLAWLLACLGTLTSLYFSEVLHLEPCNLCWYQRISLFPLTVILGIASWRGFVGISVYALPQVIGGLLFAIYQIMIQQIPGWNPIDLCGKGHACTEKVFIGLGPITIPMLSALGFFVVGALLLATTLLSRRPQRGAEKQ